MKIVKKSSGKKLFMFSVGVTGEYDETKKEQYQQVLETMDGIYVRDKKSKERLEKLASDKVCEIKVIPDSVFSLSGESAKPSNKVLLGITGLFRHNKHNMLTFESENSMFEYYLDMIKGDAYKGKSVGLIYNDKNDKKASEAFLKYASEHGRDDLTLEKITDEHELQKIIAGANTVISARMHALILAYSAGKQVVPIRFSEKMLSFEERYLKNKVDITEMKKELFEAVTEVKDNILRK